MPSPTQIAGISGGNFYECILLGNGWNKRRLVLFCTICGLERKTDLISQARLSGRTDLEEAFDAGIVIVRRKNRVLMDVMHELAISLALGTIFPVLVAMRC